MRFLLQKVLQKSKLNERGKKKCWGLVGNKTKMFPQIQRTDFCHRIREGRESEKLKSEDLRKPMILFLS